MVFYGSVHPFFLVLIFVVSQILLGFVLRRPGKKLPIVWEFVTRTAHRFEKRLNRKKRSSGTRLVRGLMLYLFLVFLVCIVIDLIHKLVPTAHSSVSVLVVMVLSMSALVPLQVTRGVYAALSQKTAVGQPDRLAAHKILKPLKLVSLDHDHYALTRKTIEFMSWGLVRLLIGPVFWYLIYGVNGMLVYVVSAAMDRELGRLTDEQRDFGRAVAIIDDVLNFVPARIGALLVVCAAFVTPSCSASRAFKTVISQAGLYQALNAGWTLAAFAGALNTSLGGAPSHKHQNKTWIGPKGSSAQTEPKTLAVVQNLYLVSLLIIVGLLSLVLIGLL